MRTPNTPAAGLPVSAEPLATALPLDHGRLANEAQYFVLRQQTLGEDAVPDAPKPAAPKSSSATSAGSAGATVSAAAAGSGWLDILARGFDPSKSIWGEAGRGAYMNNRALEIFRQLPKEQVDKLMASAKNEAELNALRNAFVGGPAHGHANAWLLEHRFGGSQTRLNESINFWNHVNVSSSPSFDPVAGRFVYPDSRWNFDAAVSGVHFSSFFVGDGLGTQTRPLANFTSVMAQAAG